ncbi:MAG: nucleotidyltransferase domain-containing protein [Candidatus Woesearchaeota archaeon]
MIQKCSLLTILEVFFKEPTAIHFIREISRKINLAQTSVRNNINNLKTEGLIQKKKAKPFDGFVANRESEKFLYYKQVYNFFSLYELRNLIVESLHPQAVVVFGSYCRGEDIEESDIDVLILSKVKKEINLEKIEKKLGRKVHIMFAEKIEDLEKKLIKSLINGWTLHGGI